MRSSRRIRPSGVRCSRCPSASQPRYRRNMIRQSESIAKLAAALVKAQAEVQNATKDSKNPHFKSGYASLAAVLDTTKPILEKYGLAVVQMPGFADGCATLDCVLVHESGEWMAGTAGAPLQKADPQG